MLGTVLGLDLVTKTCVTVQPLRGVDVLETEFSCQLLCQWCLKLSALVIIIMPDGSICFPGSKPSRGSRAWQIEKGSPLYHWLSCCWSMGHILQAYGPLLWAPGLESSHPIIGGHTGPHRLPQGQGVGSCCCKTSGSGNAGQMAGFRRQSGSQRESDKGGPREPVLLSSNCPSSVGRKGQGICRTTLPEDTRSRTEPPPSS